MGTGRQPCHEKAPGERRSRAACTWMGPLVVTWGSLAAATLGSVPKQQHGLGHNHSRGAAIPSHAAMIRECTLHHAAFQRKFGVFHFLSLSSMTTDLRSFE